MDRWIHNELGFFNSPSDALAVVPPGSRSFSLFAYRLQPVRFVNGRAESISIPTLPIDPLPHEFVALGFDIVSRSVSSFFECSPLSCNGMANEVPVNRFCLVDTLAEAVTLGERFSRERLEPGPYYIVEVLRGPAEGLV